MTVVASIVVANWLAGGGPPLSGAGSEGPTLSGAEPLIDDVSESAAPRLTVSALNSLTPLAVAEPEGLKLKADGEAVVGGVATGPGDVPGPLQLIVLDPE